MLGVAYYTEPYLLRSELAILQRIDPWIPLLMGPVGLLVYWFIGLLVCWSLVCWLTKPLLVWLPVPTFHWIQRDEGGLLARSLVQYLDS